MAQKIWTSQNILGPVKGTRHSFVIYSKICKPWSWPIRQSDLVISFSSTNPNQDNLLRSIVSSLWYKGLRVESFTHQVLVPILLNIFSQTVLAMNGKSFLEKIIYKNAIANHSVSLQKVCC